MTTILDEVRALRAAVDDLRRAIIDPAVWKAEHHARHAARVGVSVCMDHRIARIHAIGPAGVDGRYASMTIDIDGRWMLRDAVVAQTREVCSAVGLPSLADRVANAVVQGRDAMVRP